MAKTYCQSCHAWADPGSLPKATWEKHILPRMGAMFGLYNHGLTREELLGEGAERAELLISNTFPEKPNIDEKDFEKIAQYILSKAPETLEKPSLQVDSTLSSFKANVPAYQLSPPSTTMIQVSNGKINIGDANSKAFYQFSPTLQMERMAIVNEGAVNMIESRDEIYLTVMGSFSPTDVPKGFFMALSKTNGKVGILLDSLRRPVHSTFGDLNEDGLLDVLVCEYGKYQGQLALYSQTNTGSFTKKVLRPKPGAIKTEVLDADGDGDLDIYALFGQADEGLFYYENQGNNEYTEKKIMGFPPTYGSSSFKILDWNKDKKWDILYTNGDNADYPPVVKPYHGVRIFLQTENQQFEEETFLPLPGAYKAIVRDFDQDGDLDIAAISFFPDYEEKLSKGFVMFWQDEGGRFRGKTLPEANLGRWIVMESADIDQDGDEDLFLGSLTFEVPGHPERVNNWVSNGIPFIMLENSVK